MQHLSFYVSSYPALFELNFNLFFQSPYSLHTLDQDFHYLLFSLGYSRSVGYHLIMENNALYTSNFQIIYSPRVFM